MGAGAAASRRAAAHRSLPAPGATPPGDSTRRPKPTHDVRQQARGSKRSFCLPKNRKLIPCTAPWDRKWRSAVVPLGGAAAEASRRRRERPCACPGDAQR
ncbi:hypothetical protein NDU88_005813 [Pleurodeles waltl]|uniref:Uncharacterized protein n=1 Tax=Pleurodeles waltl TaxID=8319 RepID=A0AAV7MB52_PLEWA|nr:hypothetical protein NDU88_005813 [Pleurodeles waltl]